MRYELRLTAYDMLDQVNIRLVVDCTPDDPAAPTWRALAKTATTRSKGISGATEWTREVLDTILHGLAEQGNPPDATGGPPGSDS